MSLLPNATFSAPGVPIYGSGGGGDGPNPSFSSISTTVLNIEDYNNPGQYPYRLRANSFSARIEKQDDSLGDLSVSTLTVSSINGAAPGGGGGGSNFNEITVSSITFSGARGPGGNDIGFPGGSYMANVGVESMKLNNTVNNAVIIFDLIGQNTVTGNPGISIVGTGTQVVQMTAGDASAITLVGSDYLAIDTCIPNIYRAQFIDSGPGPAPAQPTVANLSATAAGGLTLTDVNAKPFIFNCSSINVSSINGAAPSGSQNLSLNTITFAGPSTVSLLMENRTILFNDGGSAASIGAAQMGWNSGASNLNIVAPSTSSVFIGTDKLNGGLSVNDDGVFARPFLSTPNLQVSSINGAAPGGGGFTAQKLSWLNAGSNILPSGGTPGVYEALTNSSAPVTDLHTYRVTACFGLSNTLADGITEIVIEGGGIGGLPATISVGPNSVTGAQVPFAGLSGYFTVAGTTGGGVRVSGFNTGDSNTTVFSDNAFVILEDLGVF